MTEVEKSLEEGSIRENGADERGGGGERIQWVYMNNTKIANQIRKAGRVQKYKDLDQTLNQVNVGRQGGERVNVWYVISQKLSVFDCMVADMIYTITMGPDWDLIERTFTLKQILRLLYGNPEQALTPARKRELEESVERLCSTQLDINCSEELVQRNIRRLDGGWIRGAFLAAVPAGRCRYRILDRECCMPLYEYASEVNRQLISFEAKYLNLSSREGGENLSKTREVMMIKHYLIRRIELMRNSNNNFKTNEIAYMRRGTSDTGMMGMLPEIGIDFSDCSSDTARRHKRQRIHRIVGQILEIYRSMGYISGYEPKTDKKGLETGYRIDCSGDGKDGMVG